MIKSERGVKFDPKICDAMLDNIVEFKHAAAEAEEAAATYSPTPLFD